MPRYIDAEELWIQLDKVDSFEQGRNHAYYKGLRKAKRILSEQPTAEVFERKKGKWILSDEQRQEDVDNGNYRFVCSECGKSDIHSKAVTVSFCWNCGAEMEKTDG